jgi:hypothetical protein
MSIDDRDDLIVLDEFRLRAADGDGSAARLVAAAAEGICDPPLLTSIDDPHDVAVLRRKAAGSPEPADPRGHAALGHLVATWQRSKRYRTRIAATIETAHPTTFRLAVTESGINHEATTPPGERPGAEPAAEPVVTLLIGVPVGTHAGLLVLVGRSGSPPGVQGPTQWPLPLSRELGVRVYRG